MNDISRLDGDLLLKAGIADETQAKFAATSFLEDDRDLHSGPIVVTGNRVPGGKIRMSDARAASPAKKAASKARKRAKKAATGARTKGTTKQKKPRATKSSKKASKKR
jgi:hypothetical protein